jgi:Tfp pilus assembly protein PilF/cellulose biosynthesis protein BcsQ
MALINVAAILVGRGRRVLAIDLDLEAPGISYLLKQEHNSPVPGFMDLILNFFVEKSDSAIAKNSDPSAYLEYTGELQVPEKMNKKGGTLRIMPAGKLDSQYEQRRQSVDLHRLYEEKKGKPLMMRLRHVIIESGQFDYVLIDSRTGFSDEAGISVRDLGDHLIVLHGLNRQNVEGTVRFIEQVRKTLDPAKALELEFVATPIPIGEDDLCDARMSEAERRFGEAWGKTVKIRHRIPYHPRLALDEEPAIFRRTQGPLHDAYMGIEECVRTMNHDTIADWAGRAQAAVKASKNDEAVDCFREAANLGGAPIAMISSACHQTVGQDNFTAYWTLLEDLDGRSRSSLLLGINHFERLRAYDEVESLYRDGLARFRNDVSFLAPFSQFLCWVRNSPDEAETLLRQALKASPNDSSLFVDLAVLLWRYRGKIKEAEDLYRHALNLDPKDSQIISRFGVFMWHARRQVDEAEELFRKANELDPRDAESTSRYGSFSWHVRRDYRKAEILYLQTLALRPESGNNLANYAGLLLAQRKFSQAEETLVRAWAASFTTQNQTSAEIAFYRGLMLRLDQKSDSVPLAYLKLILEEGFPRMLWSFDDVLRIAGEKMNAKHYDLYRSLAAAILDPDCIKPLKSLPLWNAVKPIRPDANI